MFLVYYVALSKMEELLMEMKLDVARLPGELSKMPSVSVQLKMDEYSTISKLAKVNSQPPISQSVITQAPPAVPTQTGAAVVTDVSRSKSPIVVRKEPATEKKALTNVTAVPAQKTSTTKYQVTYTSGTGANAGTKVQLPPGSGLAVQTAQGNIVVYSVASSVNTTQTVSIVQGGSVMGGASTVSTNSGGQAYTLGVPAYIDGSNLYQTVHLVPAVTAAASTIGSGSQQVVYWPSQNSTTAGTSQITMVPQGQVLQPVQFGTEPSSKETTVTVEKKKNTPPSVITID